MAFGWFDLTGTGAVCVAATRWYRSICAPGRRQFGYEPGSLRRLWVVPWAVCIDAGRGPQWLCRDEVGAAAWAGLLRNLYRQVPAQAVGLSISK